MAVGERKEALSSIITLMKSSLSVQYKHIKTKYVNTDMKKIHKNKTTKCRHTLLGVISIHVTYDNSVLAC